ncbi:hypothetical protein BAR153v2_001330 [Bartonella sp. AR 15-3]
MQTMNNNSTETNKKSTNTSYKKTIPISGKFFVELKTFYDEKTLLQDTE